MTQYVTTNWITSQDVAANKPDPDCPTEAWVQGWTDGMQFGKSAINPYSPSSQDAVAWDEGRDAAVED